ncbi:MAG: hypothetical protein ACREPM_07305 [Gemmatimonadaceae bacterium]
MSRVRRFIAGIALSLTAGGLAQAQTATQSVGIQVQSIDQITVAGAPSLVINAAVAGSQPTQATASGTYAITTNDTSRIVTVEIDNDMPANTLLKITMAAPTGGTSAGAITLSSTPQNAVTGFGMVIGSGLAIGYTLDATVAAGLIASTSRTVTFTIIAGP